jgi:hypothetical protein
MSGRIKEREGPERSPKGQHVAHRPQAHSLIRPGNDVKGPRAVDAASDGRLASSRGITFLPTEGTSRLRPQVPVIDGVSDLSDLRRKGGDGGCRLVGRTGRWLRSEAETQPCT